MKIAIVYPPLPSEKGVALLSQNRQFQWFSRPTYIFPVVPATAATMMKEAGHDVLFLDGIASEISLEEFDSKLQAFSPNYVVLETKTPVVKRHWKWIDEAKKKSSAKIVLVGDHVTAMPEESMENCPVDFILTGGDWDFLLKNLVASNDDDSKYESGIWYRKDGEVKNTLSFTDGSAHTIKGMYVTIPAITLYCMLNGNQFSQAYDEDDFLKLVATGTKADGSKTSVEILLADGNNYDTWALDWTYFDLSALGEVTEVAFHMEEAQIDDYGYAQYYRSPMYFAFDDVEVEF